MVHAQRLRSLWDGRGDADANAAADACIGDAFEDADEQHRMTLLAYVYAMAQIDGLETAAERDLYASYRERLTGSWFRRLDEDLVNQVERSVLAEIHLPETDVAVEYGIDLRDFIPVLAQVPETTRNAYADGAGP